jgi:hypothetical protein
LLFLPASAWQQRPVRNRDERVLAVARQVPGLVAQYLAELPSTTHLLLVGEVPEALRGLPEHRTHVLPVCPPDRYSQLLCASDAVLAMTFQAVTLIRAMYAGIPGIVLTNGHDVAGPGDRERADAAIGGLTPGVRRWLDEAGEIYRFRLWPLSMYALMEPVLRDNPYLRTVMHRELLDERGVVSGLTALLHDAGERDRLAGERERYLQRVAALGDTADVFEAALRKAR